MRPVLFAAVAASALAASVALAQSPPPPEAGSPPPPPRELPYGRPGGYGYRRPPPPKAAVFRFRAGDRSVFVKCADDENTKACTDGVAAMMSAINPAQPAR